jgi:hypothetical protein
MLAAAVLLLVGGKRLLPGPSKWNAARLNRLAADLETELSERIFEAKLMARLAGLRALDATLAGLATIPVKVGRVDMAVDRFKAQQVAGKFSRDWAEKATKRAALGDADSAIGAASEAMQHRVQIVGEVESSDAWNTARTQAAADVEVDGGVLTKTWSSALERNTCSICRSLDGRTILASESWPYGDPGAVHPHCQCDDYIEVVPRWMVSAYIDA